MAIYIFVYLNQWIVYSMVNIQNTGIFFLYSQFNNIEISQAYRSHIIKKNCLIHSLNKNFLNAYYVLSTV